MKGPHPDEGDELPELIPATFVKGSRAICSIPSPNLVRGGGHGPSTPPRLNYHAIDGATDNRLGRHHSEAMTFPRS